MPARPTLLALLLVPALAACDSAAPFTIGGTYVGAVTVPDDAGGEVRATLSLGIPETESGPFTLSSGTVSANGLSVRVSGGGTYTPPAITFAFDAPVPDLQLDAVTGVVSPDGDRIVVEVEGVPVALTRQ